MIVNAYVIISLLRDPFTAKELLPKLLDSWIVNHHRSLGSSLSGSNLVAFRSGPTLASLESRVLGHIVSLGSNQIVSHVMLLHLTAMHPPDSWRPEARCIVLHGLIQGVAVHVG